MGNQIEYIIWQVKKNKMDASSEKKMNVILGDSRALMGINPMGISNSYYNLALGGGTFLEGYYSLKRTLKKNKIDTVILCYGIYHYESDHFFMQSTVSFNFIESSELNEVINLERKLNASVESKVSGKAGYMRSIERFLSYQHFSFTYQSTFIDNLLNNSLPPSKLKIGEQLSKKKGFYLCENNELVIKKAHEFYEEHFVFNPVLEAYLDSLNQLITKNNITCYLLVPPTSRLTYGKDESIYFTEFRNALTNVQKKYKSFHVVQSLPVYENEMFGDDSHLNEKGSKYYTSEVKKILLPSAGQNITRD
ncbi:MAG: hypothetical protein NT150_03970 [Bacteroidetes bacterium]|nr:hypothetical protein [Bacteroidota bacterium]